VQFRWSSAAQTVCPFCHSILVRNDLVLENVGTVADLPPDPSPIQLLTTGIYKGKTFEVIGGSFTNTIRAAGTNGTSYSLTATARGYPMRNCSTRCRSW